MSTDSQFAVKSVDMIGMYLNPPQNALVISIDEKPSIQALERASDFIYTSSGKIVRGLKSTYKRPDFHAFLDELVTEVPVDQETHVIMDNYCTHKKNDDWLLAHPNVSFHFTPTSASWFNRVEIWFGIMTGNALRGASFSSTEQLA